MKQAKKVFLEIICVIIVFFVFAIILFSHYGKNREVEYVNPRFVVVDYEDLQKQASLLVINKTNETAKNVFVLNYHVVTKNDPSDSYEISYNQFKENMFALKSQGYQTVNLSDFYLFLRGEKDLPDKSFLLTFDDGAKAAYYNADPVLKVLNYTAVMFVITGFSLSEESNVYYLNKSELLEAQNTSRWELEPHTHRSHYRPIINESGEVGPALTNKLWIGNESRLETNEEYFTRISTDLRTAKDLLEYNFNKKVTAFALPFGDFGEPRSNYPEAHKILYALTTELHKMVFYQFSPSKMRYYRANYNDVREESYVIVRLSVDNLRQPNQLLEEIEASRALSLPYYEDYSNKNRWPTLAGELKLNNTEFILSDHPTERSEVMLVYLDGSYLLENYTYSLQLNELNDSTVSLIARLKDSANYVSCQYRNNTARIVNVNGNVPSRITEAVVNITSSPVLSISVLGDRVACFLNGDEVVSSEINNIPAYGGVGIKIDRKYGQNKTFTFSEISITENYNGSL